MKKKGSRYVANGSTSSSLGLKNGLIKGTISINLKPKQKGSGLSSRSVRVRAQKGGRYQPKDVTGMPPLSTRGERSDDESNESGEKTWCSDATSSDLAIDKKPKEVTKSVSETIFRNDIPAENRILSIGLSKVGFGVQRQCRVVRGLNIGRFKAFYGVPPVTVRAIFNDLKEAYASVELEYLLLALNWLNLYSTEPVMSGRWGFCYDHIRKMTKVYAKMIQSLKERKITFDGFDPDEIHLISVDTVSFRTQEFRNDPSSDWFDFKSHSSGLKYEFACALRRPKVPKSLFGCLQFSV